MVLRESSVRVAGLVLVLLALSPAGDAALGALQEPQGGEPPARVLQLTLEDALRVALKQNLGLEFEQLASEVSRYDAAGSWGSFDPVLDLSGTLSEQETQGTSQLAGAAVVESDQRRVDGSLTVPFRTGGSVSLSLRHSNDKTNNQFAAFDISTTDVLTVALTQPLLKGGWSRFATSRQRELEIAYLRQLQSEKAVRQGILLGVYEAYWDLVSAIEEVKGREVALDRGTEQYKQDKRRLELGAGTEVDLLQSETNVAQQDELLLNARFVLRQAEDTLRKLLFQKPDTGEGFLDEWDWPIEPLTPLPGVEPRDLDWRRSLNRAIEERPVLWQRRFDIDAAAVALDRAESEWWPRLDLDLSSSSTGFDVEASESFEIARGWDFPSSSASLTFSVPLWNRSGRHGLSSARAALRRAQLDFDLAELDVLAEVRAAVRDVRYRAEAVAAARKSAELAERQLQAEETRMDIGLSTTFQVLEFQETLATAQSTLVRAQAAYAKALVKLEHAEGVLELGRDERPAER